MGQNGFHWRRAYQEQRLKVLKHWGLIWTMTLVVALVSGLGITFPVLAEEGGVQIPPEILQQAEQLFEDALSATSVGDFAAAEADWTQMLEKLPDNPAILSNRGNTRLSQNNLQGAMADYNRSIELAPDQSDPYLNRGIVQEKLGQWQKAIADYNVVLKSDPEDAVAYNNRGNAKAGLGDWQGAIADYQRAADIVPTYSFARANYALALYQTGQRDEAIQTMRRLILKYPQFADMRAALAAALWVEGRQGEAESNWVAVTRLDNRYQDLDWVSQERRWPPAMVIALGKFLTMEQGT